MSLFGFCFDLIFISISISCHDLCLDVLYKLHKTHVIFRFLFRFDEMTTHPKTIEKNMRFQIKPFFLDVLVQKPTRANESQREPTTAQGGQISLRRGEKRRG